MSPPMNTVQYQSYHTSIISLLAPFVELLVEFLSPYQFSELQICFIMTDLWQRDIGNNDSIQCTRSILWSSRLVASRMVLVFRVRSCSLLVIGLPWHRSFSHVDIRFRAGRRGLLA